VSSVKRICKDPLGACRIASAHRHGNKSKPVCYRNHHLRRSDTDMDDLRGTFSKLKKNIKHRLTGRERGAGKTGAGGRGETVNSPGSLPQPDSPVAMGSDREREGKESNAEDESVESTAAPGENKSRWKSTTSASSKLLLRGVRDSADAFPPLKSVAGGLCFILENCEVWSPSLNATHNAH